MNLYTRLIQSIPGMGKNTDELLTERTLTEFPKPLMLPWNLQCPLRLTPAKKSLHPKSPEYPPNTN